MRVMCIFIGRRSRELENAISNFRVHPACQRTDFLAIYPRKKTENRSSNSAKVIAGSRNLSGSRNDPFEDLDFIYDRGAQDDLDDDYVTAHRRYRERAAAAFEEDLAELRRKRRDMQDRIFDVIDLNAEIEKARTTLEAADVAFQRHAPKFDNRDECEGMSLAEKLDRSRKIANMDIAPEKQSAKSFKWIKVPDVDVDSYGPQPTKGRQNRVNSVVEAAAITDPLDAVSLQPLKRRFLKRKKSVSF